MQPRRRKRPRGRPCRRSQNDITRKGRAGGRGGGDLEQESNRQTMEYIDGGIHPAVDGQSLGER